MFFCVCSFWNLQEVPDCKGCQEFSFESALPLVDSNVTMLIASNQAAAGWRAKIGQEFCQGNWRAFSKWGLIINIGDIKGERWVKNPLIRKPYFVWGRWPWGIAIILIPMILCMHHPFYRTRFDTSDGRLHPLFPFVISPIQCCFQKTTTNHHNIVSQIHKASDLSSHLILVIGRSCWCPITLHRVNVGCSQLYGSIVYATLWLCCYRIDAGSVSWLLRFHNILFGLVTGIF